MICILTPAFHRLLLCELTDQVMNETTSKDSPIQGHPVELLYAIFRYTCPGFRSRIQLTHICRLWRKIAIDGTSLWTYVEGPNTYHDCQNELEYHLSLLEIQLSRTGGLPLDVVYFYPSSHEHDEKILNVFRESGSFQCWQSLTLRMDYASVFDTQNYLTIFVSNVFPNIKTIKIIHAGSRASSVLSLIEQAAAPRYTDTLRRPATLRLEVIDVNMSTAIVDKACIKYKSNSAYLWEQQFSDFEHRPPQYYWD